jgi:hypothetical protein
MTLFDALEVVLEFVHQWPHPRRRHVFLGEVLEPGQDEYPVVDCVEEIARQVLYAVASCRPEGSSVVSAAGDSDELEESRATGKSFVSWESTMSSL